MNKTIEEKRELGAFYTKSDIITAYIIKRLELTDGLTILEPAAGDGEFIKALENSSKEVDITAFDIDPVAVKHLRKEFNNIIVEEKNTIKEVQSRLNMFNHIKWDRILGNPPYGAKISKEDKKKFLKLYPEINVTESYALFIVNCIKRLKENGILSFIISDTFLHLNSHDKLRRFILNTCKIKEIVLTKTKLFPGINYQYAGLCMFTVQRCNNEDQRNNNELRFVNRIKDLETLEKLNEINFSDLPLFIESEFIKQENYLNFVDNIFYQAGIPKKILELFLDGVSLVGEFVDCKTGIYSGENTRHFKILKNTKETEKFVKAGYGVVTLPEIINRVLNADEKIEGIKEKPYFVPLMKGGSGRYYKKPVWFIDWSVNSINYMLSNKKARVQNADYYFRKGICMSLINSNRQQARFIEEVIFDQSDNGYFPKNSNLIYYFLGFFNSRLFNYMLKKIINPTANSTVNYVKKIPVLIPNTDKLSEVNTIVKSIIESKKKAEDKSIKEKEKEIDKFFYEIYALSSDEVAVIEDFCYHLR